MLDHAVEPEAEFTFGLKKNEPKDTLVVTAFVAASANTSTAISNNL